MLVLAWLLLVASAHAIGETNWLKDYSTYSAALRTHLLSTYDSTSPPISTRSGDPSSPSGPSLAGAEVEVGIRFFKVNEVDLVSGSMSLKVWFRMSWTDERLSWDPLLWNNVTQVPFAQKELWLPDIGHYNAKEGVQNTLEPAVIIIGNTGSIYWSRPGMMDIMCKFSGLANFPRDKLRCSFDVGGWAMSGATQGLALMGTGFAFSNQEASAGSSYQQFTIDYVDATIQTYTYPCCPAEPWPVIIYTVALTRNAGYFDRFFYFIVIITTLSTLPAFMSFEIGERLGYGITVVLVVEVSKGTLASYLPVCGEFLWADMLIEASIYVCLLALLETCVVLGLSYYMGETILPKWFLHLCSRIKERCRSRGKGLNEASEGRELEKLFTNSSEPSAGIIFRQNDDSEGQRQRGRNPDEPWGVQDMTKLINFERLFHALDEKHTNVLPFDVIERFLAYAAPNMTPQQRKDAIGQMDISKDQQVACWEFLMLAIDLLWAADKEAIDTALRAYQAAMHAESERSVTRWRAVSKAVDGYSRILLPTAYLSFVVVHYQTEYSDWYASQPTKGMFRLLGPTDVSGPGVGYSLILPLLFVGSVILWWATVQLAKRENIIETKTSPAALMKLKAQISWL